MTRKRNCLYQARKKGLLVAGWMTLLAVVCSASTLNAQQPPGPREAREPAQNDQLIELNRGPVHEAFAQPYQMKSGGEFVVNQEPPQPIEEVPPRQVPQSSEYEWIPGYWGWEPGDKRFIWISGIFRKAPEEMTWNPGYWTQADNGYAWVSGCWVKDQQLYLISETPPDPKPEEPGRQPSPQHFWVPGHWDYVQRDYEWEPGFWARGIEDRVWMPARYLWTPRGYLAVDGYWDYPLEERGILYSPVAFRDLPNPGYRYSPRMVVRTSYLPTHLFVYDRYGHYCYGDYYGFNPGHGRFYPWARANARYYDPLRIFFTTFRRDRFDYYRNRHDYYHDHNDFRPRHTWRDQRQFLSGRNVNVADALLAVGINELLDNDNGFRSRYQFDENRERWNREAERSNRFNALRERRESAFRPQGDGRRNDSGQIDLGPIRVNVNPNEVPNAVKRQRERAQSSDADRGRRDENRARPATDPRENRKPDDRPIKRETRKLPIPRESDRDNRPQKPGRPELPNRPETPNEPDLPNRPETPNEPDLPNRPETPNEPDLPNRPETPNEPELPNRPETPQRPDLPDRPEKPQKPDVPKIKPGERPQPKQERPPRNAKKPDIPDKKPGKGPQPKEKPGKPPRNEKKPDNPPGQGKEGGQGNPGKGPGKPNEKKKD